MNYQIFIQNISRCSHLPSKQKIKRWAASILKKHCKKAEMTIRVVNKNEMARLNRAYRKKKGPTNILSFPFEVPSDIDTTFIGDLVICSDIVQQEATLQSKTLEAHWAHLIIHGILHLLGYDHVKQSDAKIMETIEIKTLKDLGFQNPY